MANQSPVHSQHHIIPIRAYLWAWVALMILLGLTIWASTITLGSIGNNVVAMLISIIKATIVVLIFMGVKYATNLTKVFAVLGFVWVLFISGILISVNTRDVVKGFNNHMDSSMPQDGGQRVLSDAEEKQLDEQTAAQEKAAELGGGPSTGLNQSGE